MDMNGGKGDDGQWRRDDDDRLFGSWLRRRSMRNRLVEGSGEGDAQAHYADVYEAVNKGSHVHDNLRSGCAVVLVL
jgi:hypothetical protein